MKCKAVSWNKATARVHELITLGKQAESLLPGYVVVAMEPGIVLELYGEDALGECIVADRVVLTERVIKILVERCGLDEKGESAFNDRD